MDKAENHLIEGADRPTGPEAFKELKRTAPPELSRWYDKEFYPNLFFEGHVEHRYKELLRLKLSKTQGCFT